MGFNVGLAEPESSTGTVQGSASLQFRAEFKYSVYQN